MEVSSSTRTLAAILSGGTNIRLWEAFGGLLIQNPELLGIYLKGSPTEKLIYQVTCGDVGLEKAVVISKALFPLMLGRLSEFSATTVYKSPWLSTWGARDRLQGFLARRCSKDFLSLYLEKHPELLDPRIATRTLTKRRLRSGPSRPIARIWPAAGRQAPKIYLHRQRLRRGRGRLLYALEDRDMRRMFTDAEIEELRLRVRYQLLPRLDEVRWNWQTNHSEDESAENHMQPLLDSFRTLTKGIP